MDVGTWASEANPQTAPPPVGNDVALDSTGKLVKGLSPEVVKEHSQDGLEGRSANQGPGTLRSPQLFCE